MVLVLEEEKTRETVAQLPVAHTITSGHVTDVTSGGPTRAQLPVAHAHNILPVGGAFGHVTSGRGHFRSRDFRSRDFR